MNKKTLSAIALMVLGLSMVLAANLDAADEQSLHLRYCNEVVTWEVEAVQGIPPEHRTGHPDYRGIAAEACPGLRPAP
ncbi:hypothetical protein RVM26_05015 [Halomonas sp. KM072]